MGVIETEQSRAVRCMQRERIRQAVRALLGSLDALDFELDPVAFFEMMDAPIEGNRNSSPYSDGTSFISYPEVILSLPIRRVKRQYRPIHTDCSNSAIGAWRASAGPHKAGFQGRSRAARGGAERQP
jgi:hypothetical protein